MADMNLEKQSFGTTQRGDEVTRYTLTNQRGHSVQLINLGATIVSVNVPDRSGQLANVNLGFPSIDGYLQRHPYFGSTVGRVCNRIANGRFELEGKVYQLATNLGRHHLHGGLVGFDAAVWQCEPLDDSDAVGLRMQLVSEDGDEGYPGTLHVRVDFSWNDDNELSYTFVAHADSPTHVNLTNHAYWNLAGVGSGNIGRHVVTVEADQMLEVDDDLIPTGRKIDVAGTPLDFRHPTPIGDRIDQLPATKGYDHCYVLRGEPNTLRKACFTLDPSSGRTMEILTTQPAMQLYTGNHLSGQADAGGFGMHEAFCFETQHPPNAANLPAFESTRLDPGQRFQQTTIHRFGVRENTSPE
ncbi:MAG: aldose epimerase family protein [Pirellulaceae bacterium]